jgi:PS-10 peptidase S37
VPKRTFDAAAMVDVANWLASEGERIIFIYGENDPWSAGAYAYGEGAARGLRTFSVAGGNHGASLTDPAIAAEARTEAFDVLRSWTGVTPVIPPPPMTPSVERAAPPEPLWVHLAPGRRRL